MPEQDDRQQITAVEQQRRNRRRYNIYLNSEFAFSIHEDVMIKHRVLKGEWMTPGDVEAILHEEGYYTAYAQALSWLGRRPHSSLEVQKYLKRKGIDSEMSSLILTRLSEQGYINDSDFAEWLVEQRILSQGKGRRWVKQELQQSGVAPEFIQNAMGRLDEEAEYASALETARKRWRLSKGDPAEKKRKLSAYLLRRGIPGSIVSRAIRQLKDEFAEASEIDDEEAYFD